MNKQIWKNKQWNTRKNLQKITITHDTVNDTKTNLNVWMTAARTLIHSLTYLLTVHQSITDLVGVRWISLRNLSCAAGSLMAGTGPCTGFGTVPGPGAVGLGIVPGPGAVRGCWYCCIFPPGLYPAGLSTVSTGLVMYLDVWNDSSAELAAYDLKQ